MKREINKKFSLYGICYMVEETSDKYPEKCVRCDIFNHINKKCRSYFNDTGECRGLWRGDGKEVIFVKL